MLTAKQAKKLKKLIRDYADWQEADSWKGSKDPESMDQIEIKFKAVKKNLFNYVKSLTDPGVTDNVSKSCNTRTSKT